MSFYENYAYKNIETETDPVFDPETDSFMVTVKNTLFVHPEAIKQAKLDAQTNVVASTAYNPVLAAQENQNVVNKILITEADRAQWLLDHNM